MLRLGLSQGILDLDGFWLCWFGGSDWGFCRSGHRARPLFGQIGWNIILGLGLNRRGLDCSELTCDAFDCGNGLIFGGCIFGGRGISGCVGGFGNRLTEDGGVQGQARGRLRVRMWAASAAVLSDAAPGAAAV